MRKFDERFFLAIAAVFCSFIAGFCFNLKEGEFAGVLASSTMCIFFLDGIARYKD